jgi:site-specific DNA-adenine methylase
MYYPGNKNICGVIQKIINQIPTATEIYELFAGSAAVSRELSVRSRVSQFYINDLDPQVISDFSCSYPAGSTITNIHAISILMYLTAVPAVHPGKFIFLDPPYLHDCRVGNTDLYNYEMSVADHTALLMIVRDLQHNCMIIHPECELYDQMLKDFRKVKLIIRYHNKTSHEALYMNYPSPTDLLVYDIYGTDCWDRERINRKGKRLINKLSQLPVLERNYILKTINKHFYYEKIQSNIY